MTNIIKNKWEKFKLRELISLLTDYHANGSYEALKKNVELLDTPEYSTMIRTTNFEKNDFEDLKYINEHAYNFLKKSKVYPNDILMNKIANAGSVYLMPDIKKPVSLGMNLFLIRTKPELADQKFVFYYLRAKEAYVKSFANGAATNTITKELVRNLEIIAPDVLTQNMIASIIFTYDGLIENNEKRISILEEMAQRLYYEWFVKFKFPGYEKVKMVESGDEYGEIPEGWKISQLDSVVDIVSGFPFKSSTYLKQGKYKIVTIKNVHNGKFIINFDSFIDELPQNFPDSCLLENGDILLSLTGNVGRACTVTGRDHLLNQRVAKLNPVKMDYKEYIYQMFRQPAFQQKLESISNGAAQQNLSPIQLKALTIIKPSELILNLFHKTCAPYFNETMLLNERNIILQNIRDLLIPQLVTGKKEIKQ